MTKFKKKMLIQKKIDGRFYTQEETKESIVDEEHIERATSPETMRFFRRGLGSRQKVERRYKNNKHIVKIFSYAPFNDNERNVIIFEEI